MTIWDWVYGRLFGGCMTLIETEWIPDVLIRQGIRYLLQTRLDDEVARDDAPFRNPVRCRVEGRRRSERRGS